MKKKLLIGFAVLTLGLVAAFNISLNAGKSNLSMLSLANVEALAYYEGGWGGGSGCNYSLLVDCFVVIVTPTWTDYTYEPGRN